VGFVWAGAVFFYTRILRCGACLLFGNEFYMKRLSFFEFFVIVLILVFLSNLVLAAEAPVVQICQLVDFSNFFDSARAWFTDVLKRYWLVLLTFYFIFVMYRCIFLFLGSEKCVEGEEDEEVTLNLKGGDIL